MPFLRVIVPVIITVMIAGCGSDPVEQNYEALSQRFSEINRNFKNSLSEVGTRREYNRALEDKNEALSQLLDRVDQLENTQAVILLKSKILLHLARYSEALKLVENLTAPNSPVRLEAAMVKVQALLMQRDTARALQLFQTIQSEVEKNEEYYTACLFFAMSAADPGAQETYAREFLTAPRLPADLEPYRSRILGKLAELAEKKGDIETARNHLQTAMEQSGNENEKNSIQRKLQQLNLIGARAPRLSAQSWFNGEPVSSAALAGKVAIIEFWAPWCSPCRSLIPVLSELREKYPPEDLRIIAVTRLYGMYRDDLVDRGAVKKEEELELINRFVERHNLPYPVAVSHEGDMFEAYGVVPVPTMVFINREGRIDSVKIGANQPETIEATVQRLLDAAPPSHP